MTAAPKLAQWWKIANTPIYWRLLRPVLADLLYPSRGRWRTPWSTLWQEVTGQVITSSVPFEAVREAAAEALESIDPESSLRRIQTQMTMTVNWLRKGPAHAAEFNAWRASLGMRPLFLAGVDLRDQDLSGYDLSRCVLLGADLRGANLIGCRFDGAVLKRVKIAGALTDKNTFSGHALEDFADGIEAEEFQAWLQRAGPKGLASLIAVTEVSRKKNLRGSHTTWTVKVHNGFGHPLRVKLWLEDGKQAIVGAGGTVEGHRARKFALKIEHETFSRNLPLQMTLYVEGLAAPIANLRAWGWERSWGKARG